MGFSFLQKLPIHNLFYSKTDMKFDLVQVRQLNPQHFLYSPFTSCLCPCCSCILLTIFAWRKIQIPWMLVWLFFHFKSRYDDFINFSAKLIWHVSLGNGLVQTWVYNRAVKLWMCKQTSQYIKKKDRWYGRYLQHIFHFHNCSVEPAVKMKHETKTFSFGRK